MLSYDASSVLGSEGPFAEQISHFKVRHSQRDMAVRIEDTIRFNGTLVAESGTGTGKTYAYLVPAILSGRKVVISTGTKYLQDQLFLRDIPKVTQVLAAPVKVSLLKGRANYLCLERLDQVTQRGQRYQSGVIDDVMEIREWRSQTSSGDISEVKSVPENSPVWPLVTSTADNCLGSKCDFYDKCFVNQARKAAQASDVTIINHHLYFADSALKQDGFGKLLPEADVWLFDEAHQLPDIASNFLGRSLSLRQITELIKDVRLAETAEKSAVRDLMPAANDFEKISRDALLLLLKQQGRMAWSDACAQTPGLEPQLRLMMQKATVLLDALSLAAVAGETLARCHERCAAICSLLDDFGQPPTDANVRWLEVMQKGFRIHETPLNIGEALQSTMSQRQVARVFTSATLSVDGRFDHYLRQMGLHEVDTQRWDSQFDYPQQAVLYLPSGLPKPNHPDYALELVNAMLPIVQAAGGRTFMLFTSYRLMNQVRQYLSGQGFTLLMQGDAAKQELIQKFLISEKPILLATMSFWEGVDIPGDALSCVMIDKLPFEAPDDPVLKARLRAIENQGENPFMGYQVPRAVISLRQGAGRLIRSQSDRGVLVLCDPRLTEARYGKVFLDSLPNMRRTRNLPDAVEFLRKSAASTER